MAKVTFDVTGVEKGQDFDTPVPVGLYTAKVAECEQTESKSSGKPMLAVTLEIAKGDHKGRKLWDYIVLDESSQWKLRQFLEALGLVKDGKTTGQFDTKKVVGDAMLVKVKHETDKEYGTRAKVGSMLPIPEDEAEELDDDDAPESEAAAPAADDDELTWEDLTEYDREDLEAVHEENELECKFNKRTSDDVLRQRIAEELGLEEPEAEGSDDSDSDDEEEDYSEWGTADLRAELKERGLKSSGPKSALVKRLEANDSEDDGDQPF